MAHPRNFGRTRGSVPHISELEIVSLKHLTVFAGDVGRGECT